ncbi:MAG: Uma2 family endonuclease [Leptolyngbyaceae cyanobacterium SM2_5_2]|nr:Uma2 family endonuclease [Leptolyngbyaceae cyanobacterium SM2_5_2]
MTDIQSLSISPTYPESDGLPMTESDVTRDTLIYCIEALKRHFESRRNVYVSGNLFLYYEEGNPKAVISPDVFVIFGVANRKRRSYETWQEGGKLPSFILEITSMTTRTNDEVSKPSLYESLGVQEYFQYDPTADYLKSQIKGSRLVDSAYQPLPLQTNSEGMAYLHSSVLGLDLQLQIPRQLVPAPTSLVKELRFFDPQTGLVLPSRQELEYERDMALQRADLLAQKLRDLGLDPDQL